MDNNLNALETIEDISKRYVDSMLCLNSTYKNLIHNYIGYKVEEVLMFAKIDRLLEKGFISKDEHEYLYRLFEERRKLESIINFTPKEDVSELFYEELNDINTELNKYGVNQTYEEILDSSIDEKMYDEVTPTLSYIKKPKHY